MQIRDLEKSDFIKHRNIIIHLLENNFSMNNPTESIKAQIFAFQKASSLESFLDDGSAIVLAAFEDDILAGFAWLYQYDHLGSRRLHLTELAVDEAHQRRGIGQLLVEQAQERAGELGVKKIDLNTSVRNINAIMFYEHLGFSQVSVRMVKELG